MTHKPIQIKTLKLEKCGHWSIYSGQYQTWWNLLDKHGYVKWSSSSHYCDSEENEPKTIRVFGTYANKSLEGRLNLETLRITHIKESIIEDKSGERRMVIVKDGKVFKKVVGTKLCWAWVKRLRKENPDSNIDFWEIKKV